ncbi:HTTM domain-containing protein [Streptomyces netropsis]|uniref:HTTM domain-containing protein n=1 Tax=Streptomyces netropsis TaxID=55404 RepID=UPI0030D3B8E5
MTSRITAALDKWASQPVSVLGVSATRALLGFVGLMYYVSQYSDRRYLFGPQGLLPHEEFLDQLAQTRTFSLYSWSSSTAWFELVFHAGMLTALAMMLGIGGRVGLALNWAFLWSIYQRQIVIIDGGENLAYVVIPLLMLTRCYDRFSFSTGTARRLAQHLPGSIKAVAAPLHNLGVVAVATQICLVYVVSGLYKVQGQSWQDGTALFYVLRVPEFTWPGVSELVYGNDLLVYLGTYATVLFLVYFPLGALIPALRPWAAVASIGFHLSIALLMGLTSFALTMVACDLIFLSKGLDQALRTTRRTYARWSSRPREVDSLIGSGPKPSSAEALPTRRQEEESFT